MSIVQFVNSSDWIISLRDHKGKIILSDLNPGESKNKTTSNISKLWRRVDVLKNGQFVNIQILGSDIINECPRIIFKSEDSGEGKRMLKIEGSRSKDIDVLLKINYIGCLLGNSSRWNKRPTKQIAREENGPYVPTLAPLEPDVPRVAGNSSVDSPRVYNSLMMGTVIGASMHHKNRHCHR